jgi:cell division protein FtsQ
MKKWIHRIKWRRIAWLLTAVILIYVTIAASYRYDAQTLASINILLNKDAGVYFLSEENIEAYLHELSIKEGVSKLNEIDISQLEHMIESNGYVDDADVFIDALSGLHVQVKQRVPILRIMNNNGVSYYADNCGNKMPLHPKFTARVIVATGHIFANNRFNDTLGQKQFNDLILLTNEILKDDFFAHMIEQIWVDENDEIHLIPMIANQDILLGNTQQIESKLQNLKCFYLNADAARINTYSVVNLKFNDQVIATKRYNNKNNTNTSTQQTP